jgi:hypothetical protein
MRVIQGGRSEVHRLCSERDVSLGGARMLKLDSRAPRMDA